MFKMLSYVSLLFVIILNSNSYCTFEYESLNDESLLQMGLKSRSVKRKSNFIDFQPTSKKPKNHHFKPIKRIVYTYDEFNITPFPPNLNILDKDDLDLIVQYDIMMNNNNFMNEPEQTEVEKILSDVVKDYTNSDSYKEMCEIFHSKE